MTLPNSPLDCTQIPSDRYIKDLELRLDNKTSRALNDAELALRTISVPDQDELACKAYKDACLYVESFANLRMSGHGAEIEDLFKIGVVKPYYTNSRNKLTKVELLRNMDAFAYACHFDRKHFDVETFCKVNSIMVKGEITDNPCSQIRVNRNDNIIENTYSFTSGIPTPDVSSLPSFMNDLTAFCNKASMPIIAQAAIAHAQLIAIHPFNRANGKTARALTQLIFAEWHINDSYIIPVSLAMSLSPREYHSAISPLIRSFFSNGINYDDLNVWITYFSSCCQYAAQEVQKFGLELNSYQEKIRDEIHPRTDSATNSLISALPGIPVFSSETATQYIGRSYKRTNSAISELVDDNIVVQITEGRRNRVFGCPGIIKLYKEIIKM